MDQRAHRQTSDIAIRSIPPDADAASAGLTELEGVILGIVWSREPCTSYVVLSRFQQSPTWGWSSSTGAIYPAIRRLKARGFLDHRAEATGRRRAELLSLSAAGEAAVRHWIADLADEMGSAGIDPIRTRVNYLAMLAPDARERFLDRAEAITRARLAITRDIVADPQARENWTLAATTLGLVRQLEARLAWLGDLRLIVRRESEPAAVPDRP